MTISEAKQRFISSSFMVNNFNLMDFGVGERCVLIVNSHRPIIQVLDISGLTDVQVVELVNLTSIVITAGCNYSYSIITRIGNTFFLN